MVLDLAKAALTAEAEAAQAMLVPARTQEGMNVDKLAGVLELSMAAHSWSLL
jgi:hypothetical protein